jgi:subtilisin family serine protease
MKTAFAALASMLALGTACSSPSSSSLSSQFPLTVMSDAGKLRVELTTAESLVVGNDQIEMLVTNMADGSPLDGMTVGVVPYMPSMGHGTSVTPTVTAEGGGKYLVTNLYLFMPGTWELETSFSGPMSDHAEPTFQLQ